MKGDESGPANDQDVRQKKGVSYKEDLREGQGQPQLRGEGPLWGVVLQAGLPGELMSPCR